MVGGRELRRKEGKKEGRKEGKGRKVGWEEGKTNLEISTHISVEILSL